MYDILLHSWEDCSISSNNGISGILERVNFDRRLNGLPRASQVYSSGNATHTAPIRFAANQVLSPRHIKSQNRIEIQSADSEI